MTPSPYYYRLRRWDQRPGAGGTADSYLVILGANVRAIEGDRDLLQQAREYLKIPDLSGAGLRRVDLVDRPTIEREVCSKLQELEANGRIQIIHRQRPPS